jgi:hypothetical protein
MAYVKPRPDFDTTLDRAGVSKAALARAAGKSDQTIHAMLNLASMPTRVWRCALQDR